jgi:hypothetical protein
MPLLTWDNAALVCGMIVGGVLMLVRQPVYIIRLKINVGPRIAPYTTTLLCCYFWEVYLPKIVSWNANCKAPFHPQTQGKIERWHQTMKNRVLLENYYLSGDLEQQIGVFVDH